VKRRQKFGNFQETKIKDILQKIKEKKEGILNIEKKYQENIRSEYISKPCASTSKGSKFAVEMSEISSTLSKYNQNKFSVDKLINSRKKKNNSAVRKVNPSQKVHNS